MNTSPLRGVRVVDMSTGIAGGYASKLLADAGADVVKLGTVNSDPLLRRQYGRGRAPLFEHLHAGQTIERVDTLTDLRSAQIVGGGDIVLAGSDDGSYLTGRSEALSSARGVVVHISPFGGGLTRTEVVSSEFVLQARCGKLDSTFGPDSRPVAAGGETGLWLAGSFAALAGVAYHLLAESTGQRIDVDLSIFEAMVTVFGQETLGVQLDPDWSNQRDMSGHRIPGIHQTRDAQVAFAVVTAQQWMDFCVMIGRADWSEQRDLVSAVGRSARKEEVLPVIEDWLRERTAQEILQTAALFRIPVGVVANGQTAPELECYHGSFTSEITGFVRPGPALRFTPLETSVEGQRGLVPRSSQRPLEGLRVADFTAFWAGPYAGSLLALLGAEVVHVESPKRPDGMRTRSVKPPSEADWLEWSSTFHANNASKLAVSIDLNSPGGIDLARSLIGNCDVMIENFSPRVMDHLGLDGAHVCEIRQDIVYARMPAFGLNNPWRDRPAFQHTIEPLAGLAWITGFPSEEVRPIMICDGLGGVHAAFGVVCGLRHRQLNGAGVHIEVRLAEVAAAIAAEQTTAWSSEEVLLERVGNQTRWGFLQGVFPCRAAPAEAPAHVAVTLEGEQEWQACARMLGFDPGESRPDASLVDRVEVALRAWCLARDPYDAIDRLTESGIPAALVSDARRVLRDEVLRERGFFTTNRHKICGPIAYAGLPFLAFTGGAALPTGHYRPAPCWGQDDGQLARLTQVDQAAIDSLISAGAVGPEEGALEPM
jgi:crotonobetainyl-CoA:carnitine CoA-transferase CaiB-like acyl-CoA transferase